MRTPKSANRTAALVTSQDAGPWAEPGDRTVTEIMRPVTTVEKDGHLAAVAYLMEHAATQAIVVLQADENRPVAIVTTEDIVRAVAHGVDAGRARLHDWMQRPPGIIGPDTTIGVAARMMLDNGHDQLPVVAEQRLVGIVSVRDILGASYPATGGTTRNTGEDPHPSDPPRTAHQPKQTGRRQPLDKKDGS